MKKLFFTAAALILAAGCSKPVDESKSEQLGKEIAEKMRAPIEDTRAITEKIQKTREIPPME